jgi:hypothetical protein
MYDPLNISYLASKILLSSIEYSLKYRPFSVNYRIFSSVNYRSFGQLSKTLRSTIEGLWITEDGAFMNIEKKKSLLVFSIVERNL